MNIRTTDIETKIFPWKYGLLTKIYLNNYGNEGFEFHTAFNYKIGPFWDVTPCSR